MNNIGYRVSAARRLMNINQKELAKMANISEGSLSRYENNIREPKSAALVNLATALNVSTDYLLGVSDEIQVKPSTECIELRDFVANFLDALDSSNFLLNGEPICRESLDSIKIAMRMGMLLAYDIQKNNKALR